MADYTKLVVQLRGEVGELIHSWVLLRHFLVGRRREATGVIEQDFKNQELWFLNAIIEKLENELFSRLSELAETVKRGRITFENAASQISRAGFAACNDEIKTFREFIRSRQFEEKRNKEISHKEFVAEWDDERAPIHVPYPVLVRAIALAMRVMKRIDREVYGTIHAKFMWHELRSRRYSMNLLPRSSYMIAQDIRVPEPVRAQIIVEETRSGKFHQELMDARVNGVIVQIYASRKWGAINLGGNLMILAHYPLQSIQDIGGEGISVAPESSPSGSTPIDATAPAAADSRPADPR